jgi:adenine-specific DNA-methyltransferase
MKKQKLELTWIGKDEQPRLEPRVLVEDSSKSYGDPSSENMLIYGDNLLALKALEQDFAGKIKCIYIDPPYNTGNAFEHYDDGLEHSLWLSLMKPRLELLHKLLHEDGTLWVSIDDLEGHYLKILCDEIFGRKCFVAGVIWRSTDNSNNDAKQFSLDHNMILVFSKLSDWKSKRLMPSEDKRQHFKNPDNDPRGPYFDGNPISSPNPRPNLCYDLISPQRNVIKSPKYGWRWSKERMQEMIATGEIRFTKDGKSIRRRTYLAEQKGGCLLPLFGLI